MVIQFKLKELIEKNGLTQHQFAKLADIRVSTVNAMCRHEELKEAGKQVKSIPLDVLEKITNFFDCNVSDVVERVRDNKN